MNIVKGTEAARPAQKEIIEALTERQPETGKGMEEAEKEISARYRQKTLARIIDEYNWTVAHH